MRAPLLWHFARVAAMNELQHRVNLWVSVVQSMIAIGAGLAVIAVVYAHVDNLSGWSRAELYVVLGVFTAVGGVTRTVIKPSMLQLVEDVRQGTLDYVLTKPVATSGVMV